MTQRGMYVVWARLRHEWHVLTWTQSRAQAERCKRTALNRHWEQVDIIFQEAPHA